MAVAHFALVTRGTRGYSARSGTSGEGAEAPKACAKGEKVWLTEYKGPQT